MERENISGEDLKRQFDEVMTDAEALEILKSNNIMIRLGRRNGKLKVYIALYKAYYALEEKVNKSGALSSYTQEKLLPKTLGISMRKCDECGKDFPTTSNDGKPCGVGFELTGGTIYYVCMSCLEKWLEGIEDISVFGKLDK